ncbi:MAG: GTP 3',8-cyclase MoaA [Bacteroidia bacterium]|nr:GTP 3',8-cyclase MoaA [Bacteroidia bacterium]
MNESRIYDNHGRPIDYVRIAVTDRCNLRCFYCMPAEGITYVNRKDLLSYEEISRLVAILAEMGVRKVRITGGEPFLRRDLMFLLEKIVSTRGIEAVHITTNGVLTAPHVPALKAMGIKSINLSLDTLDRQRFMEMTRRDELPKVQECLEALLANGISTKINAVVMEGKNVEDIIPLTELGRKDPVEVRFIEEMPFNGAGANYPRLAWNHRRILQELKSHYPEIHKIPDPDHSTSENYQIPGFAGTVGIIPAFTRTFCGTCNRIRLTAVGQLKTCLYDDGVLDIRALLRSGAADGEIRTAFLKAFSNRAKDGYEAEKRRSADRPVNESMSTIGG